MFKVFRVDIMKKYKKDNFINPAKANLQSGQKILGRLS